MSKIGKNKKHARSVILLILLFILLLLLHALSMPPASEYDLTMSCDYLQYAKNRNLAPNFLNTFNPDASITQSEFLSLLGQSLCVNAEHFSSSSNPADITSDVEYLNWAMRNKLIGEHSNITTPSLAAFSHDEPLNCEQMASILGHLLDTGCLDIETPSIASQNLTGAENFNTVEEESLKTLLALEVLPRDKDGAIAPQGNVTQAEALLAVVSLLWNAKNTRPALNDGAHLRIEYSAWDYQNDEDSWIVLQSVPFQRSESRYGKSWRCIEDMESYQEIVAELNTLIDTYCLIAPPLDPIGLDEAFFSEHNLIALNYQSFMDPQFDVMIKQQMLGRSTLWVKTHVHTHGAWTASATGYLFLITVPKSVSQVVWAWWLP